MDKRPQPGYRQEAFICPYCRVLTSQIWQQTYVRRNPSGMRNIDVEIAQCFNCTKLTIWFERILIHPAVSTAPMPNDDLPQSAKEDYLEARAIEQRSPRGAAALLRLAIQKLCVELGESGENINRDIASLVSKGLDRRVQQALDIVRVTGNHAVHPGQINLSDDPERTELLFSIVNEIVEELITKPKRMQALFDQLPDQDKKAIHKRDAKQP